MIWIDAATNPDSLQVMMGGEFLNAPLPVLLSYGTPVELTFTAVRGPRAYAYDGVRIIASSACEYAAWTCAGAGACVLLAVAEVVEGSHLAHCYFVECVHRFSLD